MNSAGRKLQLCLSFPENPSDSCGFLCYWKEALVSILEKKQHTFLTLEESTWISMADHSFSPLCKSGKCFVLQFDMTWSQDVKNTTKLPAFEYNEAVFPGSKDLFPRQWWFYLRSGQQRIYRQKKKIIAKESTYLPAFTKGQLCVRMCVKSYTYIIKISGI